MSPENVLESVRDLLSRFVDAVPREQIGLETSIVHDLGLTSLKMVDLTLAIEDAFGLEEFPIQDFIDAEAKKAKAGFTVRALVDACVRAISGA